MRSRKKRAVFQPIGIVRNSVRERIEGGWGRVHSRIVLHPEFAAGLRGIEEFSHLMVIFWLDRAGEDPEPFKLVRSPRGNPKWKPTGVFAQRTKQRVNPIGVTVVRLLKKRGRTLLVSGLDAIEGTPVLDLKPYFPTFDRPARFRVPRWVLPAMRGYY